MRYEIRKLKDLKPAPWNPRKISPEALKGLQASIKKFGLVEPVIINEDGEIIGGHQRVKALEALGKNEAEVVVVNLTKADEKALNIALNNPSLTGEFTNDLQIVLEEIKLDLPDLFTELKLDDLYRPAPKAGLTDADAIPEKIPARVKTGEIWELGKHRLICGDATSVKDVVDLMDGKMAVLMNTDPPYGIDYIKLKGSGYGDIENDNLVDGASLQKFLEAAIRAAVPYLKEGTAFYLWHPMLTQGTFFAAAAAADILIHRQIIWVKPSLVLTRSGMYHWKHELCFYGWIRGHKPPWYGDKSQTTVWEVGRENDSIHPTQKPVELFIRPIKNHTKPGEIIYEPFAGSGSQIIAAEQTERIAYAIEIEPKYCDVIIKRWENFTGQKAKRIGSRYEGHVVKYCPKCDKPLKDCGCGKTRKVK